ncbi:hypothetical protein C2S52_012804 [Perilla frutescens var. hirtella]|nr:hypothetical protein C2S52_012804 [Perilla frutescens var. hirtella]
MGESSPPPECITDDEENQGKKSSLSEGTMVLIIGLNSTHEIWNALESNFASQSRAKLMQYKLQLQTLKKDNLSMKDYLSLGHEHDPVMMSITSRIEPWSVIDVQTLLLTFEARVEFMKWNTINSNSSQPLANLTQSSKQRGDFSNSYNTRGRGYQGGNQSNRGGKGYHRGGFRGRAEIKIVSMSVKFALFLVILWIDVGIDMIKIMSHELYKHSSSNTQLREITNKTTFSKIIPSTWHRCLQSTPLLSTTLMDLGNLILVLVIMSLMILVT